LIRRGALLGALLLAPAIAIAGCGSSSTQHTVTLTVSDPAACARIAQIAAHSQSPAAVRVGVGVALPPVPAGLTVDTAEILAPARRAVRIPAGSSAIAIPIPGRRLLILIGSFNGTMQGLLTELRASLARAGLRTAGPASQSYSTGGLAAFTQNYLTGGKRPLEGSYDAVDCNGSPRVVLEQELPHRARKPRRHRLSSRRRSHAGV
jgi:hypothetical protein